MKSYKEGRHFESLKTNVRIISVSKTNSDPTNFLLSSGYKITKNFQIVGYIWISDILFLAFTILPNNSKEIENEKDKEKDKEKEQSKMSDQTLLHLTNNSKLNYYGLIKKVCGNPQIAEYDEQIFEISKIFEK